MVCFGNGKRLDGCLLYGFWAWSDQYQAIPSGVETLVTWNQKRDENPAGMMDLATETATIPIEGWWTFTSSLEIVLAIRGNFYHRWYKNLVYVGGQSESYDIAGTVVTNAAFVDYFQIGDTVQVRCFQNTGVACNLIGCCNQLWFSGALICEA